MLLSIKTRNLYIGNKKKGPKHGPKIPFKHSDRCFKINSDQCMVNYEDALESLCYSRTQDDKSHLKCLYSQHRIETQ